MGIDTTDQIGEEEEVTDNGFETALSSLRRGDFNSIQASQLAGDNVDRLLKLRRTLIRMFGTRIGDKNRVVLEFLNEKEESVVLFV